MGRKQKAERWRDRLGTWILLCVFLVGIAVMLYPTVSDWWNKRVTTHVVADYNALVEDMVEEDYSAFFEAAQAYNDALLAVGSSTAIASPGLVYANYDETLDITGTGIMGYVTIDKINVELPIYHGTDSGVLQLGAGHLEGSSLPIGGESSHCAITAYRGLSSARLFTDLDQLEAGDTFTITVLNQVLTYEVDQISVVLPSETDVLTIEDGKDYCTLMTCTPYGVNSHRLLVHGVRVENVDSFLHVSAEAYQVEVLVVATVIAVPLLLFLLVGILVHKRKRRHRKKK